MTIIKNFYFLFRVRSPRNNCGKFIEYLVPALHLTAIFCALHSFISNEGEFRLAVSKILKGNHIVRTVYGLMFDSILRRLNLVSLRDRRATCRAPPSPPPATSRKTAGSGFARPAGKPARSSMIWKSDDQETSG